jgi:hypothetical protein
VLPDASPEAALSFSATPSSGWSTALPFDTEEYPFSVGARARRVGSWGFWEGSKITDQPPPSPVNCSSAAAQCEEEVQLRLVPFGATNLRISVFPWARA